MQIIDTMLLLSTCLYIQNRETLEVQNNKESFATCLVRVGARDTDRVEQVFQAMWDRPQVESHLPCY